ncbi:MAG TPA: hypothetical protein VK901_12620 [Nitrospiraceae bacterium]|nr:hypothetical protein [Nitrospiraceae bacterium]
MNRAERAPCCVQCAREQLQHHAVTDPGHSRIAAGTGRLQLMVNLRTATTNPWLANIAATSRMGPVTWKIPNTAAGPPTALQSPDESGTCACVDINRLGILDNHPVSLSG